MTAKIRARVVGGALQLDEPVDLPDNTPVEVTVSPLSDVAEAGPNGPAMGLGFLDVLISADVHGPADWSANIDHYLYGTRRTE